MQAAGGVMDLALAYRADGTLLALSIRDVTDEGKNLISPAQHNLIKLGNIANGYRIPAVRYEACRYSPTRVPAAPTGASASRSCASPWSARWRCWPGASGRSGRAAACATT
jgi:hypothetical protein